MKNNELDILDVVKKYGLLGDREQQILKLRFGLGCNEHTLQEVGKIFNVTRTCIQQIEAKAIRKLQHSIRNRRLLEFFPAYSSSLSIFR